MNRIGFNHKSHNIMTAWLVCLLSVVCMQAAALPVVGASSSDRSYVESLLIGKNKKKAKSTLNQDVAVHDTDTQNSVAPLSYADQRRYQYFLHEAIAQQNAENYDAAFDLWRHCLEINPNAPEAYYYLSMFYSELGDEKKEEWCLEKAASLSPENSYYQEKLADYNILQKNYDEAIETYERLYAHNHDRTDALNVLLQLYNRNKDYDNMLYTVERLEQNEGYSEELALTKMNAYERKGDTNNAYKTLKNLAERHPNDNNYKVMLGNWLMQKNKTKEAFKMFSAAQKDEPDNAMLKISLYDYYQTLGQKDQAQQLRDEILLNEKTDIQTKMTMLQQLISENERNGSDSTEILNIMRQMVDANKTDVNLPLLMAAYMQIKNMPQDSVNLVLEKVLEIEPENVGARLQILESTWKKEAWDDVISQASTAIQYIPEEMAFYYYLGFAHFQKDERDEALDSFKRGVSQIKSDSNPVIVSDFYGMMGDLYHQKGEIKAAFEAYDSCLQWKDDNMMALNNYAYFLSVEDTLLSKAEAMSLKTVRAEPDNTTYLDTYAWILFMQERYAEAKIYIDQALKCDTDSIHSNVVIEHVGDIYAMNGLIDKAVEYWQEALQKGSESATIEEKIKKKKYIKDK